MQLDFRQVREDETDVYLALMHAAYAPVKALGIKFDAATADRAMALRHLQSHGVYALYADEKMVSSVTVRYIPGGRCPARLVCRILAGSARTLTIPASSLVVRCWNGSNRRF